MRLPKLFLLLIVSTFALSHLVTAQAAPVNNDWSNRETITLPYNDTETGVFAATTEASDPAFSCKNGNSGFNTVWYSYTAVTNEQIAVNTFGSNYDTLLAVYTGAPGAFAQVGCNDNAPSSQQSSLMFTATAGQSYSLIVASVFPLGGGETLQINLSSGATPINDNILMATPLSMPFTETVNNTFAAIDETDPLPNCATTIAGSLWYSYSTSNYETLTLSFTGNTFTPVLAVYAGTPDALVQYRCANNGSLTFTTQPNTTFYILLAGDGNSVGLVTLEASATALTTHTFNVNTTSDTRDLSSGNQVCADGIGNCSLRAAIMEANALAPAASIINLPLGTYTLVLPGTGENDAWSGDLDIKTTISINGADKMTTIINGNQIDRVFELMGSSSLNIKNVTVSGGKTTSDGGGIDNTTGSTLFIDQVTMTGNEANRGGAISTNGFTYASNFFVTSNKATNGGGLQNDGYFLLKDSSISNNQAVNFGGGIATGSQMMLIENSTISGNEVTVSYGSAGGIGGGKVDIRNSVVSHNRLSGYGTGLFLDNNSRIINTTIDNNQSINGFADLYLVGGTIDMEGSTLSNYYGYGMSAIVGTVNITNSTFTSESVGGIINANAHVHLNNVTTDGISHNYDNNTTAITTVENSIVMNCWNGGNASQFQSWGHNLVKTTTFCPFNHPTDIVAEPYLGELGNNGGTTLTRLPAPVSPAINAGNNATCATVDQRGISRPYGAACDIGAVEVNNSDPGIFVSTRDLFLTETGSSKSYYVLLNTQPTANVVIDVVADPQTRLIIGNGQVNNQSLTFTPLNWNQPQTLTVRALDDPNAEDLHHPGLVTHSVNTGSAAEYLNVSIIAINIDILDNDGLVTATLSPHEPSPTMTPEPPTATHTQVLATETSIPPTAIYTHDPLIPTNTATIGVEPNTPIPFGLIAPSNGSVVTSPIPQFTWMVYPPTISYGLRVVDSFNFVVVNTTFDAVDICNATTCSVDTASLDIELANTETYTWQVRVDAFPVFNSETFTFNTNFALPAKPTLLEPANDGTVTTLSPVIRWLESPNATEYRLRVMDSFDVRALNRWFDAGDVCANGMCQVNLGALGVLLDNNEDYEWRVRAKNAIGAVNSARWEFTVQLQIPAAFSLISPADNAIIDTRRPVLQWQESANTVTYRVRIKDDTDGTIMFKLNNVPPSACVDGICTLDTSTVPYLLPLKKNEDYEWFVQARNPAGKRKSPKWTFTYVSVE